MVLIAVCFFSVRSRPVAIPILGAITPALGFYAYSAIAYLMFGREEDVFVFGAMWLMSFFTYCLLVAAGLVVGLLCPARVNNWFRYGIGLVVGPLAVVGFLLFERVFL